MIPDSLQTIAEISIGLAGFSGLIVALRKKTGPFTGVQKFRLQVLLVLTFGSMFLSLLPDLLTNLGVAENVIWTSCAAAMLAFSLTFVIWMIRAGVRVARVVPEIFNWWIFYSLVSGHALVILVQTAVIAGFADNRSPGTFMLGLIWYLLHAAYQFSRMLFVLPRSPKHV